MTFTVTVIGTIVGSLAWAAFCAWMGYNYSQAARAEQDELKRQMDIADSEASGLGEAVAELQQKLDESESRVKESEALVAKAMAAAESASGMIDAERRKARELFEVVESVLKERDQWKKMWFDHGREHLNAQTQLENAIEQLRGWLKSSLVSLNSYRQKNGQSPIAFGANPKDPPVGTAARFESLLEQAKAEAPASVDGLADRSRIMEQA